MRHRAARSILILALGLAALAPRPAAGRALPSAAAACPTWRWVVLGNDPQCRLAPPGWTARPLFPRLGNPDLARRLGLDRFCLLEARPFPVSPLFPVPGTPPTLTLPASRDCAVVTAAAADDDLEASVRPVFTRNFLAQAGAVDLALFPRETPRTRLAFLDTQPAVVPGQEPRSEHGASLAGMARRLACNRAGSCAAEITTHLALANFDFDPVNPDKPQRDEVRGGTFGGLADLAQAIVGEVDAWRRDGHRPHLVLNLSVGWDGEAFGGLTEPTVGALPAAMQGVYRALEYANRQGVLVIAAAGNRAAGRVTHRPLLPAAWETLGPYRTGPPLVYAVGGVDSSGDPLPNARQGGLPQRVAYGDHATVGADTDPRKVAVLTGSSVAAAVVATTAAVVWHYRSDLNAQEVMRLVEESADRPGGRASFFPGALAGTLVAPRLLRISLCPAVARALAGGGPACLIPQCRPWIPAPPGMTRAQNLDASPVPHLVAPAGPVAPGPGCRDREVWFLNPASLAANVCPVESDDESQDQPWTHPQPSSDPCPSCPLVPTVRRPPEAQDAAGPSFTYALKVRIREDWPGPDCLTAKTVELVGPGYLKPITFVVDRPLCKGGEVKEILLDLPQPLTRTAATLYFEMADPGASQPLVIQNEVFVTP